MRDQMVRATMFVDHAHAMGLIHSDKRPLIVVGAGAAGVTAALRASSRAVVVYVIEKSGHAFGLQLGSHRWVSPNFYDWPTGAWHRPEFSSSDWREPLGFREGIAQEVAKAWTNTLSAGAVAGVRLLFERALREEIPAYVPSENGVLVEITHLRATDSSDEQRIQGGLLLLARGIGQERTWPGSATAPSTYRGYRFWEDDPFATAEGLDDSQTLHVLISGGGDGALQDCVRILLSLDKRVIALDGNESNSPRDLLTTVLRLANNDGVAFGADLAHGIAEEEELWRRTAALSDAPGERHALHSRLQHRHAEFAAALARSSKVCEFIVRLAKRRPNVNVSLLHSCDHFDPYYGVNRLLALLVRLVLPDRCNIMSRLQLMAVTPADTHACSQPAACFGKPHSITVSERSCLGMVMTARPIRKTPIRKTYNVVVIRHGLTPYDPAGTPAVLRGRRRAQLLPHRSPMPT
jgi:hypothetical protein